MEKRNLEYFTSILENMYEGVYFVDNYRKITFWNRGAEEITGYLSSEILGRYCYDNLLNHVTEDGMQLCIMGCPLHSTIVDGHKREAEVYLQHKEGHRVKVGVRTIPIEDNGTIVGAIEAFSQINTNTNYYKANLDDNVLGSGVEHLKSLALHDQLTLLPNRRYVESKLSSKFAEFADIEIPFGVLFLDLDFFRAVNNKYGHDIGDYVLQSIAKTFLHATNDNDFISRWGGEEFVAIIDVDSREKLTQVAERMRILAQNTVLRLSDSNEISMTVSIGGSMIRPGDTKEILVKRADIMMYESKSNGRNKVTID